jgi:rhodanese-related sulfurtransferase
MYQNINARAYHSDFIKGSRQHALIDVRTPMEFMQGHLPDAQNIPLNELNARVDEIPGDIPVIVVCASGNRSRTGAQRIKRAGRTEVYNLEGGTFGWLREGLPIER